MSHVWRHVPESARALGAAQTPDYQVSGNFPIALLLGGKGWSKGQPAPDPIAIAPKGSGGRRTINTGGGAYVEGNVHVRGGDFVGRDSIVYGDRVRGDRTPTGAPPGQGAPYGEVEAIFATLTRIVGAMPDGPQKTIAQSAMQGLEQEASKGMGAQESAVRQWFGFLAQAVPDVWKVALAMFRTPAAGLSPAFKRAAEQVATEDEDAA
jgi:hypothetical protein